MPFKNEKEVADKIKGADKLSARKRRQFMHVFNSCYEKNGEDSMCYAQAWSVVRKTACDPCVREKAAHELERIAFDLITVNPVIARSISREAHIVRRGS